MKIALIGATGFVGSRILTEALARGHDVTAIVRNPDKVQRHPKLTARMGDVLDQGSLAALVTAHDAVISAYNPGLPCGDRGVRTIIDAVKQAGVAHLLAVGGAGTTAPPRHPV
jgi:putative NADH-flavin reductase